MALTAPLRGSIATIAAALALGAIPLDRRYANCSSTAFSITICNSLSMVSCKLFPGIGSC